MKADVSVIIPSFNSAATISACVMSAIEQTLKPNEIIVVDDCSQDQTVNIVQDLMDRTGFPIKLVVNDRNRGPAYCRNIGIKTATAKYIAFLDADDVWRPQKVEKQYIFMQNNGCFLSGHGSNAYHPVSPHIAHVKFSSLLHKNYFVTPSVMMKRSEEYRFDEDMMFCEDHDLWIRIARGHACFLLPDDLVILGRRPMSKGGLSSKRWEMRRGQLRIYRKLRAENAISFVKYVALVSLSLIKHTVRIFSPGIRETI